MKISIKKRLESLKYFLFLRISSNIRKQRKNPKSIPVIIINFNQLDNLKNLVNFLLSRNFENIVIIDNNSSYPALIAYYKTIENKITIERMSGNEGHDVFFKNQDLQNKYGKGYYFVTDSDIWPNQALPENFAGEMLSLLNRFFNKVTKVGFAIDTQTIPDFYPFKDKVIKWESRFWEKEILENIFLSEVDTTFAIYKPFYPKSFKRIDFHKALRIGGNYTCKHMGWYINPQALTEEQKFYFETANRSSSWKMNSDGELADEYYNNLYK